MPFASARSKQRLISGSSTLHCFRVMNVETLSRLRATLVIDMTADFEVFRGFRAEIRAIVDASRGSAPLLASAWQAFSHWRSQAPVGRGGPGEPRCQDSVLLPESQSSARHNSGHSTSQIPLACPLEYNSFPKSRHSHNSCLSSTRGLFLRS